jgi:hypothetical protein
MALRIDLFLRPNDIKPCLHFPSTLLHVTYPSLGRCCHVSASDNLRKWDLALSSPFRLHHCFHPFLHLKGRHEFGLPPDAGVFTWDFFWLEASPKKEQNETSPYVNKIVRPVGRALSRRDKYCSAQCARCLLLQYGNLDLLPFLLLAIAPSAS